MRIETFDAYRILGPLAEPRKRLEKVRIWATGIGFALYVGVMLVLVDDRGFWMQSHVNQTPRPTLTAFALIGLPGLVVLALIAYWQLALESRAVRGSVSLVEDDLTLSVGEVVKRRVNVRDARLSIGAWLSNGRPCGPMLRVEGPSESITVGARSSEPPREGPTGVPDAELSDEHFRELVATLGLDEGAYDAEASGPPR